MSREQEIEAGEKAATHLAAIRLRHRRIKSGLPFDICDRCHTYWPCDAADLLVQLKDEREKLAALVREAKAKHCCQHCREEWIDRILQGGEL